MNKNSITDLSEERMALIRIWDYGIRGARNYCENNDYTAIHNLPEIGGWTAACENISTLFKISANQFDDFMVLAQSDQLYIELLTPYFEKVYGIIQSFRAESEIDSRHLAQFTLFELEILGNLDSIIKEVSNVVNSIRKSIVLNCQKELGILGVDWKKLINEINFNRMKYEEAIIHINNNYGYRLIFGDDLKQEHENLIAKDYGPTFITHYESTLKFFNMKFSEDKKTVNSADLILPFSGESAGMSEREHKYEVLKDKLQFSPMLKQVKDLGGSEEQFSWYIEHHKERDIPLHSGAGIGIPRVIQSLLSFNDIRNSVPFYIAKGHIK